MKKIGTDLWIHDDEMSLMGTQLRLRMTIVRLSEGDLWIHSPTPLSATLVQEIEQLGNVVYIVGASNGHNSWLCQWHEQYPDAQLHVSAGIPAKVELKSYTVLDGGDLWQPDLLQAAMPGVPFFNESVFLHTSTKSLIVTDLIQHYDHVMPKGLRARIAKSLFGLLGFKDKCVAPPLKMGFVRKDKAGFVKFIETVKSWDFDKIIVTHGDIIDEDAKDTFNQLCVRFTAHA